MNATMKSTKPKAAEVDEKTLKYGTFSALIFAAITIVQILSDLSGLAGGSAAYASTVAISSFAGLIILILIIAGVALLLLSFNALAKIYNEKKIIKNLLIGIFGVWIIAFIIIIVGGASIAFSSLQGLNSTALQNQTLVQSRINATLSSGSLMTYAILAGIVPALALIVTMYFVMSSLDIIGERSNIQKFTTSGRMLLASAIISFVVSAMVLVILSNTLAPMLGEIGGTIGSLVAIYGWMLLYYSFKDLSGKKEVAGQAKSGKDLKK
jgi:uncharacterized membrane protein